ncbi:MAG: YlxM family DNA-binding protein [Bacillota bacterium]|nr:YlxM family DNA-binding protein [Clostridia bacterium]
MIEKLARMAMLYDFYGQLLTAKQQRMMELFYHDDLSLSEIAQEYGISRQAVYDILKRTEKILEGYERKLQLLEKFQEQEKRIARIRELVILTQETRNLDYLSHISAIIQEINELERK